MRIIIEVDTDRADGEHYGEAVVNNIIQALDRQKTCADTDSLRLIINDRGQGIGTLEIMHGPNQHIREKREMLAQMRSQKG